jgi:cytochrome b561
MTATGYAWPAKLLHWLSAVAVLSAIGLGLAMLNVESGPTQNRLFDLHRSFGATVLMLTGARLLWRLYAPPPPPVGDMPAWQAFAARHTHHLLYVLLFAVPAMGWAGTSAFGARIEVFGLFELMPILERDRELAATLLQLHGLLAFTLCAVLALHIGAALHHHFVRKDDTLRRMLP